MRRFVPPFVALLIWLSYESRIRADGADLLDFDPLADPTIKQAVDRGLAYLERSDDPRLGARALQARALIYLGKREHPFVRRAVDAVRETIAASPTEDVTLIYGLGLSLAMLTELDAKQYRPEIDGLLRLLLRRQMAAGGWGYPNSETCDTSMTQYGVYGLWMASKAGIDVDEAVWIKATNWLLRTQDPGGAWGYQGRDPGGMDRVRQAQIRRSMVEAALASLHLCGDHLRFWELVAAPRNENVSKLMRRIDDAVRKPPPPGVDRARLNEALTLGNRWDDASDEPVYAAYPLYHWYTIERYRTFRQAQSGLRDDDGPWFRQGIDELLRTQHADGSWSGQEGGVAGTGFAVLYLLRSTRRTLQKIEGLGAGTLAGGRGLPKSGDENERPTKSAEIVTRPNQSMQDLLRRLDDPQFLASLERLDEIKPVPGEPPPSEMKKRLLELAKSDAPEAKAAALHALARTHDLSQVPVLIEAITDSDPTVYQAAVDGLRFLTRRAADYGRPVSPDSAVRRADAELWREWYRSIRPAGR